MILLPEVKKFIEANIEDIEKENMHEVFQQSMIWLNQEEFDQLYHILEELPLIYDLDEPIQDVIRDTCRQIIKKNSDEYICIEEEWGKYSEHFFKDIDDILEEFDEFEWDIRNRKHWCTVY